MSARNRAEDSQVLKSRSSPPLPTDLPDSTSESTYSKDESHWIKDTHHNSDSIRGPLSADEPSDLEPFLASQSSAPILASTKRLSIWGLAFLAFFSVSGGPFGIESTPHPTNSRSVGPKRFLNFTVPLGAIADANPLVVIILLFVFPWFWSLPWYVLGRFNQFLFCLTFAFFIAAQ